VSSCYRRLGDLQKSLELYIQIHHDFPDNIESLQYLEALCKDLGRPFDEYSKKLDKLRRSVPVAQVTQQPTARPSAAATSSAPQRSERPKPERSERPGQASLEKSMKELSSSGASGTSPLKAPSVRNTGSVGGAPPPKRGPSVNDDEDDFADTDVGDLLG